jgi:hypothetical protein
MPTRPEDQPNTARLWFAEADQMYPIPLDEDPQQRNARTYESLLRALPDRNPEYCWDLVTAQETAIVELISQGAAYLATCFARSEAVPGELTTAQFGVMISDAELPTDDSLAAMARELSTRNGQHGVSYEYLSVGRAIAIDQADNGTCCAQVIIPFPDRKRIAALVLSTKDGPDWPDYRNLLIAIARTVSFTDPAEVHSGQ